MAKYIAKIGDWVSPRESSGSIQNTSKSVTIEVTNNATENSGLLLAPMQIINFEGSVYVRSAGNRDATFTAVPFKVAAGGGGSSGGGSSYVLPTASASLKGGVKIGAGLTMTGEVLSADKQVVDWVADTSYVVGDLVIYNGAIYQAKKAHTSGATFNESDWASISSSGTVIKEWESNTRYKVGDIVISDNKFYKCVIAHTSGSSIAIQTYWASLISLGLLESWQHSHFYRFNEVVTLKNGSIYRCLTNHTSSSDFFTDVAKWELVHSDLKEWQASTYYTVGVTVIHNEKLYMCKANHTSGTTFDNGKWTLVGGGDSYTIPDWETGKEYKEDNVVYYYGTIYRCNNDHTSTTFSSDNVNWNIIYSDLENWQASVYYKSGTTVVYDNIVYKCTTAHESASSFDATKWQRIGGSTLTAWVTGKLYKVGDKVIYNNSLYTSNTEHTSSTFQSDVTSWNLIYADIKTWQANTYYTVGVVVINGAKIYRCSVAHTSDSTFDVTELARWVELGDGKGFDNWTTDTNYEIGDIIVYDNIIYVCNLDHTSDSVDFANDISKWNLFHTPTAFVKDWVVNTKYEQNQIVLHSNGLYRCSTSHVSGSSFDDVNWLRIKVDPSSLTANEIKDLIDIFD